MRQQTHGEAWPFDDPEAHRWDEHEAPSSGLAAPITSLASDRRRTRRGSGGVGRRGGCAVAYTSGHGICPPATCAR